MYIYVQQIYVYIYIFTYICIYISYFTDIKFALAIIDKIEINKKKFGDDLLDMKNNAGVCTYVFMYMSFYEQTYIYI
jgi:hypothetical protein